MPEAAMASITSPEQGAQQECSNTFLLWFGATNTGRLVEVDEGVDFVITNQINSLPHAIKRVRHRVECERGLGVGELPWLPANVDCVDNA